MEIRMKKQMENILLWMGKHAVGKSVVLGVYESRVPEILKRQQETKTKENQ